MISEHDKIPSEDPDEGSYAPTLTRLLSNKDELDFPGKLLSKEDILDSIPPQKFLFSFRAKPNLQALILERDTISHTLRNIVGAGGRLVLEHRLLVVIAILDLLLAEELLRNPESEKGIGEKETTLYILTDWEIAYFAKK